MIISILHTIDNKLSFHILLNTQQFTQSILLILIKLQLDKGLGFPYYLKHT